MQLEYYSLAVPKTPGKGAHVLSALKEAGVNFVGVWWYPISKREARIDLLPEDAACLKKAARQLDIELGKKRTAFHLSGKDHPGVVADALARLADKGVNVQAVQAICAGDGRFEALIQVDEGDVKKAGKALA